MTRQSSKERWERLAELTKATNVPIITATQIKPSQSVSIRIPMRQIHDNNLIVIVDYLDLINPKREYSK